MDGRKSKGYAWAVSAGLNAALAAIYAKFFSYQFIRYGLVVLFNVAMWGCYVNSLKALPSLQATVTNFATNFLSSGLAGFFLFEELLSFQWFSGALFIVVGVLILSKSSIEIKESTDGGSGRIMVCCTSLEYIKITAVRTTRASTYDLNGCYSNRAILNQGSGPIPIASSAMKGDSTFVFQGP